MASEMTIVIKADRFSHHDACEVSRLALQAAPAQRVIIDLGRAGEAETSAFAQLVQLRRRLLRGGGDLSLRGLRDHAAGLYEVNRLDRILPRN